MPLPPSAGRTLRAAAVVALGVLAVALARPGVAEKPAGPDGEFAAARPALAKYCLDCHSTKAKKGSLDLERFATAADARKAVKVWEGVVEQVEAGEMPPKGKPQPTDAERQALVRGVRGFLDAEARARSGDPGHVPLRRLSNAEYDCTIRDLTGVDLRPAREFPADAAAGEGFTNAAEALSDVSPALLTKYLNAAKDIADHAVLLPDGFRFSPSKARRDWTDEATAALRKFYAGHAAGDGRLNVQPYLLAAVRHRDALLAGSVTPADVAGKEKLNAKYLAALWAALADRTPSQPLDAIRASWRAATEKDVPALAADVAGWQAALWRKANVGSYVRQDPAGPVENLSRQVASDPPAAESVPLKVAVKPTPGLSDVTLYLSATEPGKVGPVVWHRPRFEGPGKPPLLLRDYAEFGPAYEADLPTAFAGTAEYLTAVAEADGDPKALADLADRHKLDPAFLKAWAKLLALPPRKKEGETDRPVIALTPLDEKTPVNDKAPAVAGWRKKGTDLPVVVANSSDKTEQVPGRVAARGVAVHPTPQEFVAVAWKSPLAGTVKVAARVAHAHPACGNGVGWWLERRRGDRAVTLAEGLLDLGKEAKPAETVKVEKGDVIVLAVDPRDAEHSCDLTEVSFTVTEDAAPGRAWELAADVSADIQADNPHGVWTFARGPAKGASPAPVVPADSLLGRWRAAAVAPERLADAAKLAVEVEALLTGPQPAKEKGADRVVYDRLVVPDGPLFAGVDVTKLARGRLKGPFGLPAARFDGESVTAEGAVEVRLPGALFAGREFVVDARLPGPAGARLVRVWAAVTPPGPDAPRDGPVLADPEGEASRALVRGNDEFRRVFPLFVCFPNVVPADEVVSLKMFHREDEPLLRLFLDAEQARRLDRLWAEHRFVSRQPVAEFDYLPQFMGFTTQDTPKAFQQFFVDRKPLFQREAEAFVAEEEAAIPKQLDALVAFAAKAYRRPLTDRERDDLPRLYRAVREKGAGHEEAFRGVLGRVLAAPAFLFRIEKAPPGKEAGPVDDWELATRLSYFLWSSMPDEELRTLAAAGRLRDPEVLAAQARRMLKDDRTRALAVEFGTQWVHVRGFDALKEKSETLFPEFDAVLRSALYEEAVLFFQHLFRADRPVTAVLDADWTFLNERLAKHYGVPGVAGPEWRRVDGVRKYGRGGMLGLGSVQARQSGASRTSPVLRGNWVVETLLGEKLPRPPAGVPQLPEAEGAGGLTVRQQVERHAKEASCAACHVRIDPFGFALEGYDPVGRRRDKDLAGLPIDAKAKLRDGNEFEGIDGLRSYLLEKKKDVVVRLFCRRLLGYALGREVTLSDAACVDEMVAELGRNDGRVTAAVLAAVRSPQFRNVRGADFGE